MEQASYVSQIIAVVAVAGSLVAIYFQRRQTNKIARAEISQTVSDNYAATLREIMNSELAGIFRKVMFERATLSPVESTQILMYFNLTLAGLRNGFFMVRDGMIDEREGRGHDTYFLAPVPKGYSSRFGWFATGARGLRHGARRTVGRRSKRL